MARLTINEIIELGDVSTYLSANYQDAGKIFGGRLAETAPQSIALVTDALRWEQESFPDIPEVRATGTITIDSTGDTGDTGLLDIVQGGITSLTNSLATLDELFPTAQYGNAVLPSVYNGYAIDIIKEEVVDEGISLLRRRVIVTDQRGVIQYEGRGIYATDDQVLIKEGQFYIDKQGQTGTSDQGNDSPTDQDITDIVTQIGYNPNSTIEGPVTPD